MSLELDDLDKKTNDFQEGPVTFEAYSGNLLITRNISKHPLMHI